MDELRGVGTEIEKKVSALTAPLDEADAILNDIREMPGRLGIDAQTFAAVLVASIKSEPSPLAGTASANAQAEIDRLGQRMLDLARKLGLIPEAAKQLIATVAQAAIKLPKLVVEVNASAQVTASNPFAGDEEKAQAKADLAAVAQVQASIMARIQDVQARIVTLPQRATQALASFATAAGGLDLVALANARRGSQGGASAAMVGGTAFAARAAGTAASSGWSSGNAATYPLSGTVSRFHPLGTGTQASTGAPSGQQAPPTSGVESDADARANVPPDEQLRALSEEVAVDLAAASAPMSDADALVVELQEAPHLLRLDPQWANTYIVAAARGEPLRASDGSHLDAELEARIQTLAVRVLTVLAEIQATPERTGALTTKGGDALLATRSIVARGTRAQDVLADPQASPETKGQARAAIKALARAEWKATRDVNTALVRGAGLAALAVTKTNAIVAALSAEEAGLPEIAVARLESMESDAVVEPLPLTPSREDTATAVAVLWPAIRRCAMGQSGVATADIVVRSDGTVTGVHVNGAPFAGAASGRCMEDVVRRARFPRFRKPTFQIRYPFSIQ